MELLPRLQPRFYSISSSSRIHPDDIHITGVVVEYQTTTGRTNKGVCTTWLKYEMDLQGGRSTWFVGLTLISDIP